MITGAEILMRALVDEKVTTLFGYPGGAIMPVYDALYDYRDRLNTFWYATNREPHTLPKAMPV